MKTNSVALHVILNCLGDFIGLHCVFPNRSFPDLQH